MDLTFQKLNSLNKNKIMAFQTINPTTNKVVKSFDEMTDTAVDTAISQAAIAFNGWKQTDYQTKSQLLYTVA
jgi:succinate-semialdehyde dehydrogenase/glutarate-semialdehyde dehydrogenase